jgi:small subunit ribosomal protein S7
MRHAKIQKRIIEADKIFNSVMVARLINRIMRNGKKTVAEDNVYRAFKLIEEKGQSPIEVFDKAIQNVSPKVEVRAKRVGGANYQVPVEVRAERKNALALRWIIESARKRSNKEFRGFDQKLAAELTAAASNEGEAIKKKDIMHKQAEANRAFAHFRF